MGLIAEGGLVRMIEWRNRVGREGRSENRGQKGTVRRNVRGSGAGEVGEN